MDSSVIDATQKDRVLRAIGRNLVSLQRLEKLLKWLSELRPVGGTLPEIDRQLKHRRQNTERSTLGKVIPLWLETAHGRESPESSRPTGLESSVYFSMQLGIPQCVLDEHAKELDQLLTERNWFVHNGLAEIDFDSDEACENLLARLDDQERRVNKQIEFLRPIVNRIREVGEFLASEDVQELMKRELLGERTP